jgi:hypothetical protein
MTKVRSWIQYLRIALKFLLASKRKLCDQVGGVCTFCFDFNDENAELDSVPENRSRIFTGEQEEAVRPGRFKPSDLF